MAYVNRGISKKNLGDLTGACKDARKAQELGADASELINEVCGKAVETIDAVAKEGKNTRVDEQKAPKLGGSNLRHSAFFYIFILLLAWFLFAALVTILNNIG